MHDLICDSNLSLQLAYSASVEFFSSIHLVEVLQTSYGLSLHGCDGSEVKAFSHRKYISVVLYISIVL